MSYANQKGGYQKSLEVTRENSNRSTTMLSTDFLKKGENYILNVTDFITNTSPPMNLFEGFFLRIKPLGDLNDSLIAAQLAQNAPPEVEFEPTVYRSWLELARQIEEFFKKLSFAEGDDDYAKFYITFDGKPNLFLSAGFLNERYIQVSSDVQEILECPEFIFKVREAAGNVYNTHLDGYAMFAANGTFRFNYRTNGCAETFSFAGPRPLTHFEQRVSVDVYSTFPLKSKILTYDGVEEHEHILFRLPYAEQHSFTSTTDFYDGNMSRDLGEISEKLDVGLTNLCDMHATTLHQLLLSGTIRNVQLKIAVRYMTKSGIVEKDFDFSNGGFWYVRLLFVKKV